MTLFTIIVLALSITVASGLPSYGSGYVKSPASSSSAATKTFPAPAAVYNSVHTPVTIPRLPCPKNYIFSCQPVLKPAPCSPHATTAAAHRESAGAYSDNTPVIVVPPEFVEGYQRN
ncbi:vitelline membrane protein Vm34Ca-like [Musca vetustissima]|uniref:vitelline membrane protein Vm34Ca-like n=1 Tax=Musca vetustissima TaxID=27455 RepID=UPI002AB64CE4|nr:vitelline membrane protein Vm34Ca-like [Musca vetustissima]